MELHLRLIGRLHFLAITSFVANDGSCAKLGRARSGENGTLQGGGGDQKYITEPRILGVDISVCLTIYNLPGAAPCLPALAWHESPGQAGQACR